MKQLEKVPEAEDKDVTLYLIIGERPMPYLAVIGHEAYCVNFSTYTNLPR